MSSSSISAPTRKAMALLLGAVGAMEFGVALWVLVFGPFNLHLGVVPVLGRTAAKPFVVAILLSSLAVLLAEPLRVGTARSHLARACDRAAYVGVLISIVPLTAP